MGMKQVWGMTGEVAPGGDTQRSEQVGKDLSRESPQPIAGKWLRFFNKLVALKKQEGPVRLWWTNGDLRDILAKCNVQTLSVS